MNERNPFTPWFLGLELARIGLEAQAVAAIRIAGMASLWFSRPQEIAQMLRDNPEAAADSFFAMLKAMRAGAGPEAVFRAALAPVDRRTGWNLRRLTAGFRPPSICG